MIKKVGILTGCESDVHLAQQICTELDKLYIAPTYIDLTQNNIIDSYHKANYCFKNSKYDFVLAVGDRTEQVGGVLAAFQNKIPIGHLYAGDHNTIATFDDKHRHVITLYSDIQFCSCPESFEHTGKLMYAAGLTPNPYYVGATHFDGISLYELDNLKIDEDYIPYLLILINSETLGKDKELIEETILKILSYAKATVPNVIITKGNGDDNCIETKLYTELNSIYYTKICMIKENRNSHLFFLSLIKNSVAFITNSSAAIYEAPRFLTEDKIILVGNRNKNRTKIPRESHSRNASKKVAKLIKQYLEKT